MGIMTEAQVSQPPSRGKDSRRLTAAEDLAYDDGTDAQYELVKGNLLEMPPESNLNARLAAFLFVQFLQLVPTIILSLN
jgi:Uma2 family endonuclease